MERLDFKFKNEELPGTIFSKEEEYLRTVFQEFMSGKRKGSWLHASKNVNNFLEKNSNIESIPFTTLQVSENKDKLHKSRDAYAIGVPESLGESIDKVWIDLLDIDPQIKEKAKALYMKLSSKRIAEVVLLLHDEPRNGVNGDKKVNPEVAVLEGIIFGYKKCCIEYYVDTRYTGKPRHLLEKKVNDFILEKEHPMHILCEKDAQEILRQVEINKKGI